MSAKGKEGIFSPVDALEKRVNTIQAAIDRLNGFMEKILRTQKKRTNPSQPKPD